MPLGSPPPMRGKEMAFSYTVVENRITPAYAGKSSRISLPMYASSGITPAYAGKRQPCLLVKVMV